MVLEPDSTYETHQVHALNCAFNTHLQKHFGFGIFTEECNFKRKKSYLFKLSLASAATSLCCFRAASTPLYLPWVPWLAQHK
jgi:hypothetical protein